MPQKWMRLTTGTPQQLARFVDDPAGLEGFVQDVLGKVRETRGEQAELLALYFEVGRPVAFALVRGLDDPITLKGVCRALGAEGVTQLLDVEQAVDAVQRGRDFGGESGSSSAAATS